MVVSIQKCLSLPIKASFGKRCDWKLQLGGKEIPFIEDQTIILLSCPYFSVSRQSESVATTKF